MEIKVFTKNSYPILIENNLNGFEKAVEGLKGNKVAVITESVVDGLYAGCLDGYFKGKEVFTYVFKAGEESKNGTVYLEVLNFLAKHNFQRQDTIVAFGGGVVGDLAGFVASTFVRGIKLIMVPTTLLSMVDSSIGGKNSINLKYGKNLAGTFYQPSLVYINTEFLKTLSNREIDSGMGEVIKYAFIGNSITYEDIKSGISNELIYKCAKIKSDIVSRDEFEGNDRKLLNLGHTIGHAIEKASNYAFSHGVCVLLGIDIALKVSKALFNLSEESYLKAKDILNLGKASYSLTFDKDLIINYVKTDKKGKGDSVDFIIINNELQAEIKNIKLEELFKVI